MQGNIDLILEANDFPDSWVELYNPTEEDINLKGYGLGLKERDAYCFDFDSIVPSHGFIILYCDKEAYDLHTDFRLDAGSGKIYLIAPDGSIEDQLSHKKQLAPNIAFGRISDGSEEWGHQLYPSPGRANEGGVSSTLLPEPQFTVPGGLYQHAFSLTVSIPDDQQLPGDVRLCITTDGREPTLSDAVLAFKPQDHDEKELQQGDVKDEERYEPQGNSTNEESHEIIYGRELALDINSSVVIRAKLISSVAHSPRATTHSYIFHPRQTELAIISIATNSDYLYDDMIGIFAEGLGDVPNYEMDLRRPVNIEYFDPENEYECTVNQNGEIKVHGNWSTRYPQKSFNVYAHKRFGTKRFNTTNFWPDKPNVVECKSFILRNGGSDCESSRIRDQLAQNLIGRNVPGTDWSANREVICYINGEYKGVYDLRERTDEDNIAANYNGLEDIDLIKEWNNVKSGNLVFTDFVKSAGALSTFEELCEWTDIEQLINMFVLEAFVCNTDFITNNIVAWRPWDGDGRWHWILEDIDRCAVSWIESEYDYFDFVRSLHSPESSQWYKDVSNIFNIIVDTEEGRALFANKMAVAMGDWLQYDYMEQVLEELYDSIKMEYLFSLKEYYPKKYMHRLNVWRKQVRHIPNWWAQRINYVYNYMLPNNCNISSQTYTLEVYPQGKDLSLNGISVYRPCFKGKYYNSLDMVISTNEEEFHGGWKIEITYEDGSMQEMFVPEKEFTIPSNGLYQKIAVEIAETTGLEDVVFGPIVWGELSNDGRIEYFNLQGLPVASPEKGQLLIEKKGNSVRKIIF